MGPVPRGAEEIEGDGEEVVVNETRVHGEEAHHGNHEAPQVP